MENEKFLSVNVITEYISRKFEYDPYLQTVYIKGELSNVKHYQSGHIYFSLKDNQSTMSAVMFKQDQRSLTFDLEDGQSVLITGTIGVYKKQGRYQLIANKVELDGLGTLFAKLEQDKKELSAGGYFDESHKKNIPEYPESIGILTSLSGAVKGDMLSTLKRRYPLAKVSIIDTRVQGVGSIESVVKNLRYADTLGFDVMILARGGGSIEDLWTFNEKEVALAVFETRTPIITGVGHEPDTTLVDYVSDLRAATPTAAIELAVYNVVDIMARIDNLNMRLYRRMTLLLDKKRQQLNNTTSHKIQHPSNLYQYQKIHLDHLTESLERSMQQSLHGQSQNFLYLKQRLYTYSPERDIRQHTQYLTGLSERLIRQIKYRLNQKQQHHRQQLQMLNSLSPTQILMRGFTYTEKDGEIVKRVEQLNVGDKIQTTIQNGKIESEVTGVENLGK